MLRLPDSLRTAFKDPLGVVYTDAEALLREAEADAPLVAVGDVVTYHLLTADVPPDVAVIDGRTERTAVDEEVRATLETVAGTERVRVDNDPATLSRDLLTALRDALAAADPVVIEVDGEEDLAALPAIAAAPEGSSVVYGQPGEGMVHVLVTPETRETATDLLRRMEGDADAALDLVGVGGDAAGAGDQDESA